MTPDFCTVNVHAETTDAYPLDDFQVTFRVVWVFDYDNGWEAECAWHRATLGNMPVDRKTAIQLFGESAVDRHERESAEELATNWRDHLEAAE